MHTTAFTGCSEAKTVIFGEKSTLTSLPTNGFNGSYITEFVVPSSVVYLESQAFFSAVSLQKVSFAPGSKCKSIGSSCFQLSAKLEVIDLSNATELESIGSRAFANALITSFTFPDSVKDIGTNAFQNCNNLKVINLSASITANMLYRMENGEWASLFTGCPSLQEINVAAENKELQSIDGILYDKAMTIIYCYPPASTLTNYQIPESIRTIGRSAFEKYPGTTIKLPDNLQTIELAAFRNSKIEHIVIPASVTQISDFAFSQINDPRLKSVTFEPGSKLSGIGRECFFGAQYLESIVIPDSVYAIGPSAFSTCTSLTEVILPAALKMSGS